LLPILNFLLPLLLTAVLVDFLRPAAVRVGLVDTPGGRKRHTGPVPLVGGIAIMSAFSLCALLFLGMVSPYEPLITGMGVLLVVGVVDDLHEVAPKNKLLHQFIAVVLMTSWGGLYLRDLGDLFGGGPVLLFDWGIPLTLFAAISVINAYNMSDGIDGLAGGWGLIAFGAMAYVANEIGAESALRLNLALIGCVGGFLLFNLRHPWRHRAAVFLGDAGSMTIGFAVVWFSVELTQRGGESGSVVPPVVMLWVLGLPLIDMFAVTVRRLAKRRNPLMPDRTHLHHVLLRVGLSDHHVVFSLMAVNCVMAVVGIVGWKAGVPENVMLLTFCALTAAYLYAARHAWRVSRMLRGSIRRTMVSRVD
jgi:UDP-GlcNAc:undecaprenyl-phosphate GlcNAc-1-phosphate transferase